MAKREQLLAFMKVMSEESDEEHPLTARMIADRVKRFTGDDITRQTIYSYIELLADYDFEILSHSPYEGYYLVDRVIEQEELEWLCHSIMANNTLPLNYSISLLSKLNNTQSTYAQEKIKHHLHIINPDKKENKQIFLSIKQISDAIDQKKKISFKYTKYNYLKEIVLKNDKEHEVEPLFMVSRDNRLYFVAYYSKYEEYIHYRVDRMIDVRIVDKPITVHEINPYEYTRHRLYMYSGELNKYVIEFSDSVMDDVIELFSTDINIKRIDSNKHMAEVKTTKSAIIYFAFQFIKHVEVIEPKETRNEITQLLRSSYDNYLIKKEER